MALLLLEVVFPWAVQFSPLTAGITVGTPEFADRHSESHYGPAGP